MKKIHIKERGITIITLVITIIILLILAGISIASLIGNDGLINKAKKAKSDYENAQEDELAKLNNILEYSIEEGNTENQSEVIVELVKEVSKLKEEMSNLKTVNLEDMYPVGSIYISTDLNTAEAVSQKFGGTWESYGQGRTLIGVGTGNDGTDNKEFTINSTGGEYNHRLSIDEMPSHSHILRRENDPNVVIGRPYQYWGDSINGQTWRTVPSGADWGETNATGNSQSHNNIQPYISVYMWKRIS